MPMSNRERRHKRIRTRIKGTSKVPRLSVFRSSRELVLQLIDDASGRTLLGLGSFSLQQGTKTERALTLGKAAAKKILELGIKRIVFDRGGYKYHGRVKALAEALRKGGLEF